MSNVDIKEVVKEKYGQAALRVKEGAAASCCGTTASVSSGCGCSDPITANLYDAAQAGQIPEEALLASLGCGNPTVLAQLKPGETVLDLGSGGGIDVLLSAKRVGATGKAYGLDMTDEMLALANENKRKAGVNKDRVLREAFRVLKPGGRFTVSDVVTRGEILPEIRQSILAWVGCIAGALQENEYRSKPKAVGFEQVDVEPTRVYRAEDARETLLHQGIDIEAIAPQVDGKFMSAFVRAVKPFAAKACCGPTCCN